MIAFMLARRSGDIGPEGRFLIGMLLWVVVLALLDRGVKTIIVGRRHSRRAVTRTGLIELAVAVLLAAAMLFFQFPPQMFHWFRHAW